MTYDPYHIIPQAVQAGVVTPLEFQVRTLVEYDANFMQDRVRSDIFINGKPAGVYAVAVADEARHAAGPHGLNRIMENRRPDLERMVIDEFMGLGYRRKVQVLEGIVRDLQDYIERDRWWQFMPVRRWFRNERISRLRTGGTA